MRETAAATGTPTEVERETAEDLEVSGTAPGSAERAPGPAPDADEADEPPAEDAVAGAPSGTEPATGSEPDEPGPDEPDEPDPEPAYGAGTRRTEMPVLPESGRRPAFTRPPGMTPPPEYLDEEDDSQAESGVRMPVGAGVPGGPGLTATAPVSSPPATGSPPGGVRMRPVDPAAAIGSARVNEAIRSTRAAAGPRGPRRARLSVKRLDPWSVMKFSFAVSLVLFIVMLVAASVLYLALDAMGVFTSVNNTLADLIESGGGDGGETFRITATGVIGTAASLGAINVVLFTALATLGAFIYNVCADLVGGVEVTLAERD